jgi:DNA-binding response OmpR family regulator
MPTVLLVADIPWVVDSVRAALSQPAYEITVLDDPRAATAVWKEHHHDVVITDLQVGSMGGMAVVRAVRDAANAEAATAPATAILGDRDADGFLAGRAGADVWLRKPFGGFELLEAVERLIGARDNARE